MFEPLVACIVGLYGLVGGSFVTAWVHRVKHKQKIARGRSKCPSCHHQLGARDLIPLFSWLAQSGKCRYCHKSIDTSYPLTEVFTALVFVLSYIVLMPESVRELVSFVLLLLVLVQMIALIIYDLRWMLLPDRMMLPLGITSVMYVASTLTSFSAVLDPLIGATIAFGFFYALFQISDGAWMGGGDVKFAPILGLLSGFPGVLVALFIAFNSGAFISLFLIGLKIKSRKDAVPFGPFLIAATFVTILYDQQIIDWYSDYLIY